MYYKEECIDGKWFYKYNPNDAWIPFTEEMMEKKRIQLVSDEYEKLRLGLPSKDDTGYMNDQKIVAAQQYALKDIQSLNDTACIGRVQKAWVNGFETCHQHLKDEYTSKINALEEWISENYVVTGNVLGITEKIKELKR